MTSNEKLAFAEVSFAADHQSMRSTGAKYQVTVVKTTVKTLKQNIVSKTTVCGK